MADTVNIVVSKCSMPVRAAFCVLLAGCGSEHSVAAGTPPPSPDATIVTANVGVINRPGLSAPPTRFYVADGSAAVTREFTPPFGTDPSVLMAYPIIARDGGIVTVEGAQRGPDDPSIGSAVFVPNDFSRKVALGPASRVLPAPDRDRVWLYTDDSTPNQRMKSKGPVFGHRTMTEVGLDGVPLSAPYLIAGSREPIGVLNDGVVMSRSGNSASYDVWNLANGTIVRSLDIHGSLGVDGGKYVTRTDYSSGCVLDCPMVIEDVTTGINRTYTPDAGQGWVTSDISAFGDRLALVERPIQDAAAPANSTVPTTVKSFDAQTGAEISSYLLRSSPVPAYTGFSSSGAWLFVTQDDDHVVGFRPESPQQSLRVINIPNASSFVVTGRSHP